MFVFVTDPPFNAVGNGIADDTAAINAALASLGSGGGSVFIPDWARCLIDSGNLVIPSNCHLVGPHVNIDTNLNNSTQPYGHLGGALVLNPTRIILVNGGASISGVVIHRKGMTFPSYGGSGYIGDCIHLAGDGATADQCMILGFDRAVYSRGWSRVEVRNCKIDCNNGIDLRQSGDTSVLHNNSGWAYAGSRYNADNVRTGAFIKLYCRNDWTQVINCQEYGYLYGYDLQNEADDLGNVFGPANVRLINCRSDDGWGGSAPYHAGKIGVRIGTEANTCKAYEVLIDGLQASCCAVAAIYSNLDPSMCLHVTSCLSWNAAQFGLVYQKGGDLIVNGGGNDGSPPFDTNTGYSIRPSLGMYSITYDVAGGAGRTIIGGGFRSVKVTTAHFRVGVATDSNNINWEDVWFDDSAPIQDNSASAPPGLHSSADMTSLLRRSENLFDLYGNAIITNLGPAPKGRRIGFNCTDSNGPTFVNNANMRTHGNTNITVSSANTYIEFIGMGSYWRMTGAPSS